ncbi:MAG: hypothetical protein BMS9Abin33_0505 [Gammaproteobacteria bacterium]|nr:MAG: hypothetical protein BMS9Abin33_0505 [Gammaproteobacteria bacterium]
MFGFFGKKAKKRKSRRKRSSGRRKQSARENIVEEIVLGGGSGIQPPVAKAYERRSKHRSWFAGVAFASKWLGLWGLLTVSGLFSHTFWFTDETRFLAIAWEMWTKAEFLVPVLNGELYLYQPPLMLWLTHLGWSVFGVNSWWPHVLPALFVLGTLVLVGWIARVLWPGKTEVARYAPLVLLGISGWAIYSTLMVTDLALVFFVVLALWALAVMGYRGSRMGGLLLGAALGLGALSNGLIIFWIVLPVSLLAPLWVSDGTRIRAGIWYQQIALATGIGVAILFSWLVPVSDSHGWPFAISLLKYYALPQPVTFFDVSQPWWGYLFLSVIVLFPWSVWPLPWMRLWHIRKQKTNDGIKFCMAMAFPVLIFLSVINIRQPQFLLPVFPFYALVITYLLMDDELVEEGEDSMWAGMGFPIILIGGILAILPKLPQTDMLPAYLWTLKPVVGIGVSLLGIGLAWAPIVRIRQRIMGIAITSVTLVILSVLAAGWLYKDFFNVSTIADKLAKIEAEGRPVAHIGKYQGRFHFSGRLHRPFVILSSNEIADWANYYPDGIIVSYENAGQPPVVPGTEPLYKANYLDTRINLWNAASIIIDAPRS